MQNLKEGGGDIFCLRVANIRLWSEDPVNIFSALVSDKRRWKEWLFAAAAKIEMIWCDDNQWQQDRTRKRKEIFVGLFGWSKKLFKRKPWFCCWRIYLMESPDLQPWDQMTRQEGRFCQKKKSQNCEITCLHKILNLRKQFYHHMILWGGDLLINLTLLSSDPPPPLRKSHPR